MNRLKLDLRAAWRSMSTQRVATAAIITVLGLGVGLVTTMFGLADPFVAKPLPYPAPRQLASISIRPVRATGLTWSTRQISAPTLREWADRRDLFRAMTPFSADPYVIRARQGDSTFVLRVADASPEALRILGQQSAPCEVAPPARCMMLMPTTFERQFAGRYDVVGTTLMTSEGASLVIAGIFSRAFRFPWPSATTPVEAVLLPETEVNRSASVSAVPSLLARLEPGVSVETARSALLTTLSDPKSWILTATSLEAKLTGSTKSMAWAALSAGLLILMVCAGNVANLLFSRGLARASELATRTALGASRRDLVRLLLTELSMLTMLAVGVGVVLATFTVASLRTTMPERYAALGEPAITLRVSVFAALAGAAVILLSSVLAWMALRRHAVAGFGTLVVRCTHAGRSLRFIIVSTQSALAMILVTGAILLGRSYNNLFGQDTGFSGNTLVVTASYPETVLGEQLTQQVEATLQLFRRIPGVTLVGASHLGLLSGGVGGPPFVADGRPVQANPRSVTIGFFEASGTVIVSGRALTATDANRSGAVVSESFAREAWPDRPAIGESIRMGTGLSAVVGVARDTFDVSLDRRPVPTIYRLLEQLSGCPPGVRCGETSINYAARVTDSAGDVSSQAARAVTRINPEALIADSSSIQQRLARSVAERVFATLVMSLFTVAALAVCVAGLVGVVAFVIARRTRELAIRVAVGARPIHVLSIVSGETVAAASVGICVGMLVARFSSTILQRLAYEVELNTWTAGLPSAAVMLLLVLVSVGLAARRALRLPVTAALRQE